MVNLAESLPIYIRINEGIKGAILNGDVKEGQQIASTTYLSKTYKLNIATVNKAINTLVDEGILFKKRGIGMFVCKGAVAKLIKERRKVFQERYIKATLIEAHRLQYTDEELQKLVKETYDSLQK